MTLQDRIQRELAKHPTHVIESLRKQGHSDERILKAIALRAQVAAGRLTEAEALAIFHGRPFRAPTVYDDTIAVPENAPATVAGAIDEFEAAFEAITGDE